MEGEQTKKTSGTMRFQRVVVMNTASGFVSTKSVTRGKMSNTTSIARGF